MASRDKDFSVDFIGVGAPRSGTTWVSRCLADHPEICFSKEKETHFFDREHNFKQGKEYYRSFFKECSPEAVKGEFTPGYFLDESIAKIIKEWFPNVKIIVVLRNPMERAFSEYVYQKKRTGERTPFSEVITDEENRAIQAGYYFRHLSAFLRHFERRRVFVALHEDALEDPITFIQQLYSFLGVDDTYVPPRLRKEINSSRTLNYRFPLLNRAIEMRRVLKRSRGGYALVQLLKKIGVNNIVKRIARLNKTRTQRTAETLTPEDRAALRRLYEEDIQKLEQFLGLGLRHWRG